MKILIAYYSRSGGTEKLALTIQKELEEKGHLVDIEKIVPLKEHGFFGWWWLKIFKNNCDIITPEINDVSDYDSVIIGSPNWTGIALPIATYLRQIQGLKYKSVGFFSTTAAPPPIEWYIFSGYLLEATFAKIIEQKGGRIRKSIIFSSIFKKWGINSDYGKKIIKDFCDYIEIPISSVKSYFAERKEAEGIHFLVISFSFLLVASFVFQILLRIQKIYVLDWSGYCIFVSIILTTFFLLTLLKDSKKGSALGKYLGAISLITLWTFSISLAHPILLKLTVFGYFLISTLIGFFRDRKLIVFTGLISVLGYSFLFYAYPFKEILVPFVDISLFLLGLMVVNLITTNLQKHFMDLLEAQQEIEETKAALEIKVTERTGELKNLTDSLDSQVREKTRKLQEKVEELERFNKMVIGRELKMLELKKEIEELKKESGR